MATSSPPTVAATAVEAEAPARSQWIERLFDVALVVKGLDGTLQLLGGLALLLIPSATQQRMAGWVRFVLIRNVDTPHSRLAGWLSDEVTNLVGSSGTHVFAVVWLLVHGVVQVVLVIALLRRILPAYPVAAVLTAFICAYEAYRYTQSHSVLLPVLAVLDLLVFVLVVREYRVLRRRHAAAARQDAPAVIPGR